MFESLRSKLESAFSRLRGKGKLSEADVDLALREIRKSLLEADVDFKVVRELVERIRARAVQLDVLESISAAQHVSTVVYEELIALMGEPAPLAIPEASDRHPDGGATGEREDDDYRQAGTAPEGLPQSPGRGL